MNRGQIGQQARRRKSNTTDSLRISISLSVVIWDDTALFLSGFPCALVFVVVPGRRFITDSCGLAALYVYVGRRGCYVLRVVTWVVRC